MTALSTLQNDATISYVKPRPYSRRRMLRQSAALGLGAAFAPHIRSETSRLLAKVHEIQVVSLRPNHYHGWPYYDY